MKSMHIKINHNKGVGGGGGGGGGGGEQNHSDQWT